MNDRIASLDQFRGYTVLGMFLVNFVGGFAAIHPILKHNHTYVSYADTIMPHFFFAAGFAYRLTFLRRSRNEGVAAAVGRGGGGGGDGEHGGVGHALHGTPGLCSRTMPLAAPLSGIPDSAG